MKALILTNGDFVTKEIKGELEDLQEIVQGYIEIPFLSKTFADKGIDVIINEEGKFIDGLRTEIAVLDKTTKQLLDIVYGNCIFMSHDEEGETIELNEEQKKIVMEELNDGAMLYDQKKDERVLVRVLYI